MPVQRGTTDVCTVPYSLIESRFVCERGSVMPRRRCRPGSNSLLLLHPAFEPHLLFVYAFNNAVGAYAHAAAHRSSAYEHMDVHADVLCGRLLDTPFPFGLVMVR